MRGCTARPIAIRQRRFGGTTTIWGGRCMPLDADRLRSTRLPAPQRLADRSCGSRAVLSRRQYSVRSRGIQILDGRGLRPAAAADDRRLYQPEFHHRLDRALQLPDRFRRALRPAAARGAQCAHPAACERHFPESRETGTAGAQRDGAHVARTRLRGERRPVRARGRRARGCAPAAWRAATCSRRASATGTMRWDGTTCATWQEPSAP